MLCEVKCKIVKIAKLSLQAISAIFVTFLMMTMSIKVFSIVTAVVFAESVVRNNHFIAISAITVLI